MRSLTIALMMVGVVSVGCERQFHTESKLRSERIAFEDASQQERFKQARFRIGQCKKMVRSL